MRLSSCAWLENARVSVKKPELTEGITSYKRGEESLVYGRLSIMIVEIQLERFTCTGISALKHVVKQNDTIPKDVSSDGILWHSL